MDNDAHRFAMEEMRPRFDRMADRHENGTAPRAVAAFQLFQTPPPIAAQLVAALELNRSDRVLEPSAGLGRILDAISKTPAWDVTAIEMAPQCAGELFRQERPEVRILQRDFLAVDPAEIGLFDAVAMNPPFHMRADIRHIEHARKFLKPGGRLAALCFNTPSRKIAFSSSFESWTDLPEASFAKEGTRVPVALVIFRN
ncbi:MAG: class I SAM-dependent methyltransferase [Solirubrobacterales bacterium]